MSHQTSSKYAAGTVAISAKNLRKSYRSLTAVRGIDLDILEGSFFGLLGPNGAGKSSTIRMLHCSSPITSGSLELFGRPVAENERWVKSKLGVVSQDNNLDSELNVMENLLVYARYFGITRSEARTRAANALAFFQLGEYSSSSCEDLSGGMKRRLVIARALMSQPKVIISGINADNQELTTQISQRDSQNPSIIADAELQRVIEAWGKLPANLKTAIMAIVGSSNFHR